MDFETFHREFFALEDELGLFEWTIDGVRIWERIRFYVHRNLLEALQIFGQGHDQVEKTTLDFVRGASLWARNLVSKNPFLSGSGDVLFWGHERRKQLEDGFWWDLYCDPFLAETDLAYRYFERDHRLDHYSPAKTPDRRYLDLITYSSTVYRTFIEREPSYQDPTLDSLESAIETRFGCHVDVTTLVYEQLTDRRVQLPLYRALLRRVDPEVAVLVVSYGKETFIEACAECDVPVVELQHGTISKYHMGYSYPGFRTKELFPDYFFAFGEFWTHGVEFPIESANVRPVGYPYLERRREQFETVTSGNQVVFLSQGTIGAQLSELAVAFSRTAPDDVEVVYKLHPGEYDRWEDEYPWLTKAEDVRVAADETPLYRLFAESSAQVGVYSTAVYEGLAFDLETFVADLPGSQYMEALFDSGAARRVEDATELAAYLARDGGTDAEPEAFFATGSIKSFEHTLDAIRRDDSPT